MLSWWPFESKKKLSNHQEDNVEMWKQDYVGRITNFFENWVKEMRKDLKMKK